MSSFLILFVTLTPIILLAPDNTFQKHPPSSSAPQLSSMSHNHTIHFALLSILHTYFPLCCYFFIPPHLQSSAAFLPSPSLCVHSAYILHFELSSTPRYLELFNFPTISPFDCTFKDPNILSLKIIQNNEYHCTRIHI